MPYKNPLDNARYAYTAARYNQPFDLDAVAEPGRLPAVHEAVRRRRLGRRQPRSATRAELHAAYDASRRAADAPAGRGRGLRRVRPVAVHRRRDDGDEVPARAADARPATPSTTTSCRRGRATRWSPSRGWSTRSSGGSSTRCESLVRGTDVHPIDYANACPDVAITSLHYYFPWAMSALREVVGVLRGHRPQAAAGHRHARRTSRSATARTSPTARSSPTTAGWPTSTSRPSATRSSARPRWPHVDEIVARVGRLARTSTTCCVETVRAIVPGARARPVRRALPRVARTLGPRPGRDPGLDPVARALRGRRAQPARVRRPGAAARHRRRRRGGGLGRVLRLGPPGGRRPRVAGDGPVDRADRRGRGDRARGPRRDGHPARAPAAVEGRARDRRARPAVGRAAALRGRARRRGRAGVHRVRGVLGRARARGPRRRGARAAARAVVGRAGAPRRRSLPRRRPGVRSCAAAAAAHAGVGGRDLAEPAPVPARRALRGVFPLFDGVGEAETPRARAARASASRTCAGSAQRRAVRRDHRGDLRAGRADERSTRWRPPGSPGGSRSSAGSAGRSRRCANGSVRGR